MATFGSLDPWKNLCLTESTHPSVITFEIEGASHCADFGLVSEDDSDALKEARKLILENIKKWIREAEEAE